MGGAYRHPNQSVEGFIESLDEVLAQISTKGIPCIVADE